ncbi:MAG: hypothetical protein II214_07365 [Alistipes sp.]|nr:hypothetical protein [Alistipes sp.]
MDKIKMWIMYHKKDVEKNRWFIDTFIDKANNYNIDMRLVNTVVISGMGTSTILHILEDDKIFLCGCVMLVISLR